MDHIGIATWYRVHQLPGVLVCPYHEIPLLTNRNVANTKRREKFFLPKALQTELNVPVLKDEKINEKLLLLSRLSAQALVASEFKGDLEILRRVYLSRLFEKGLATSRFNLKIGPLINEFSEFWSGLENIEPFNSLLSSLHTPGSWLLLLCRNPRTQRHPLQHLLMTGFLSGNLNSMLLPIGMSESAEIQPARANPELIKEQIQTLHRNGATLKQTADTVGLSEKTVRSKAARIGLFYKFRTTKIRICVQAKVRLALAAGSSIDDIVAATNLPPDRIAEIAQQTPSERSKHYEAGLENRRSICRENFLSSLKHSDFSGFWSLKDIISADFYWLLRNDKIWLMRQKNLMET